MIEKEQRQQGLKRKLFQLLLVFVHLQNRNIKVEKGTKTLNEG